MGGTAAILTPSSPPTGCTMEEVGKGGSHVPKLSEVKHQIGAHDRAA